jgi:hypothetical protein
VRFEELELRAERVQGHRIVSVRITRREAASEAESAEPAADHPVAKAPPAGK